MRKREKNLPDLLGNILIRRTRNHILRWYGFDEETDQPVDPSRFQEYLDGHRRAYVVVGGNKQFFPKRVLETISYNIEETYQGLYSSAAGTYRKTTPQPITIASSNGELTYARYGLWNYVVKAKQKQEPYTNLQRSGINLRGLMRILLFKRFESSVYAFKMSVHRLLKIHERFLEALEEGIVPAGDASARHSLRPQRAQRSRGTGPDGCVEAGCQRDTTLRISKSRPCVQILSMTSSYYGRCQTLCHQSPPPKMRSCKSFKKRLAEPPLNEGKCLIFTQYADTARYLSENINPNGERDDIDVIYSGDKSKERVVGRFAPKANPEYQFQRGEVGTVHPHRHRRAGGRA